MLTGTTTRQAEDRRRLCDLPAESRCELLELDLPEALRDRVMEQGFVPGAFVEVARSAPSGDPRVYRVDGVEIALRRETAAGLLVRDRARNRGAE